MIVFRPTSDRWIARTLSYALIESYHESIPKGRYPLAFVFFELRSGGGRRECASAKREIRFRSESTVRSFVIRAVLQRLRELGDADGRMIDPAMTATSNLSWWTGYFYDHSCAAGHSSAAAALSVAVAPGRFDFHRQAFSIPSLLLDPQRSRRRSIRERPREIPHTLGVRLVGLAMAATRCSRLPPGWCCWSRRAAHERVWFERLQEHFGW